jgi:hypothetical protein
LSEASPGRIFISYRRQETAWPAGRLYDVLVEHFPAKQVFKDVDDIEPGEDFVERITAAVASCDVLLALIGPQWLTMIDENGHRRLDNPEDFVRLEIEAALTRKIRVIPILVDEARMPRVNEMPPALAPLVRRNAVEINPLTFDTRRLVTAVQKTLAEVKVSDATPGSASPPSSAGSDRSDLQGAEAEVEQLYDRALGAFWTEQWDEAVDLLSQVLNRQPDYADAARKLELARRHQQLAINYAQASAAADAEDWEQAIAGYSWIVNADAGYRDTTARLANARQQHQLATLLREARRLHRAGQWAAVIKVGEQVQAIDPAAADPDGLMTSARAEFAAEQQAATLAADYHTALRLLDADRLDEAVKALERVTQLDSAYLNAPALLDRARKELKQAAAAHAEHEARQLAEDQARQKTEEEQRTRRAEAQKQARQLAEDQAGQKTEEEQRTRRAEAQKQAGRRAEEKEAQQSHQQPEQQTKTRMQDIPPAAPATPAWDRPSADQTKPPDRKSRRLPGRVLVLVGILTAVVVFILALTSGGVLYDDFSDQANGWDDAGSTRTGGHYTNGAYRIYAQPTGEDHYEVGAPRQASKAYPAAPRDIEITVDAKAIAAPPAGTAYGIACRVGQNSTGFYGYAFTVGPDYVSISKLGVDGSYREVVSQPLPEGFNTAGINHLRAVCSDEGDQAGTHLVFSMNDNQVAEATDTENPLGVGTVALFAATSKDSKKAVEVEFDNFDVWKW